MPFLRPKYGIPNLRMQELHPILYRFIEDEYIDRFFQTGELQISTIPRCRKIENKERRDVHEAVYGYEFVDSEGSHYLDARVGENAFVLCASLTQAACHDENYKHCLELRSIDMLAEEIGVQLVEQGYDVREILSGPCNYSEKLRVIDLSGSDTTFKELVMKKDCNGLYKPDSEKVDAVLNRLGRGAFYTTKSFRYMFEFEYRILWLCQSDIPADPVIVKIQHPEWFGEKIPSVDIVERKVV